MAKLELENSGQVFSLEERAEYTLGRSDPATHSFPDIDLAPFGALDAGVSRRHAKITRLGGGRYYIMDLASTNYTHVNGEKLEAFEPRPLADGDEIYMGTLKLVFRA
ncbi:FHA domain-containing protein [Candidatus Solincola tengchongensis]|uniref:FHA domain-containing protein n=1 Tax=Candidatus Solincola tengchongensis TaxID=2900693 RepID=UPI00257FA7F1|nr:FHA domain-containing protein [Candidatus Solincola tengchongensis]